MATQRGGPQHKLSGYDGVRIRHVFEDALCHDRRGESVLGNTSGPPCPHAAPDVGRLLVYRKERAMA